MIGRNQLKKMDSKSIMQVIYQEENKYPKINQSNYDYARKLYNKKMKEERINTKR